MSMNVTGNYTTDLEKLKNNQGNNKVEEGSSSVVDMSSEPTAEVELTEEEQAAVEAEMAAKAEEEAKEIAQATAAQAAAAVENPADADPVSEVTSPEIEKIKGDIKALETKKAENEKKMDKLEKEMERLAKDAEEKILKAAEIQEQEVKDHEEECKAAVSAELAKYIEANKKEPGSMTRDELQENIKANIPDFPSIGEALSLATEANAELHEITSLLGDYNKLIKDSQNIDQQIGALNNQLDDAVKAAEEQAKKDAAYDDDCCTKPDPITFNTADGTQYDFIVDDGAFDTTSDFLGAEDQWSAMQALDTSGDGIVDSNELKAGNIGLVKTAADGTRTTVSSEDLAKELGDDFKVNLNSYSEGGAVDGLDSANQTLLGTFNVEMNGQTLDGYNTADSAEFLEAEYGVKSDLATNPITDEANNAVDAAETNAYEARNQFAEAMTKKVETLSQQVKDIFTTIFGTDEQFALLDEEAENEGVMSANAFLIENGITDEKEDKVEDEEVPALGGEDSEVEAVPETEENAETDDKKDETVLGQTDTEEKTEEEKKLDEELAGLV